MKCLNCGCKTNNPKFCSLRCAAVVNGRKHPKRKLEGRCVVCQSPISASRKFCKGCYSKDVTLEQATYDRNGYKPNAYALVRVRARAKIKKLGWTKCMKCGYDIHVEAAHVRPISEFSEDTLLSVINDESNLLALCPNHHWEFDHGLLKVEHLGIEPS